MVVSDHKLLILLKKEIIHIIKTFFYLSRSVTLFIKGIHSFRNDSFI